MGKRINNDIWVGSIISLRGLKLVFQVKDYRKECTFCGWNPFAMQEWVIFLLVCGMKCDTTDPIGDCRQAHFSYRLLTAKQKPQSPTISNYIMAEYDRRACMQRDDSELTGSMSNLWVIFEKPSEEGNDEEVEYDDDFISLLGQSFSDLSLGSSLPERSFHQPRMTAKSSCKRIDRTSLLQRMKSGSTSLDPSLDTSENDSSTSCSTSQSSVCYFSGDRWSPCSPSKKKVHQRPPLLMPQLPDLSLLRRDSDKKSTLDTSPRRPIRTLCTEERPRLTL